MAGRQERRGRQRAALVGLATGVVTRAAADHSLEELDGLARAAGADVVLRLVQERPAPDPALYLGRGKVGMLKQACAELDVDVVIFDNELSPAQLRNLEKELGCGHRPHAADPRHLRAARAHPRGQLQVELAQLEYLLPRLAGRGDALSRLGGGIGTRGPGETQLETDRRRIRERIIALEQELERDAPAPRSCATAAAKAMLPTVALVGYTNAGKTTLFNRLTGSERARRGRAVRHARSAGCVRSADRRGRSAAVDTVGFIRDLPHAWSPRSAPRSRRSCQADLLLHVVDASDPDRERHVEAVERVLTEIRRTRCRGSASTTRSIGSPTTIGHA